MIEIFHDISLTIKFCSTAPGNNRLTKYFHKHFIPNGKTKKTTNKGNKLIKYSFNLIPPNK